MRSLQLHHLVNSESTNKLHSQSQCSPQIRSAVNYHKTPQFMAIVQIGCYVPALNGKLYARNMGICCCALASANPVPSKEIVGAVQTFTTSSIASVVKIMHESQLFQQCASAVGLMAFAMWGLEPLLWFIHRIILRNENQSYKESQLNHDVRTYVRPVLLWIGIILICRAFDPIVLSTQASQVIKQRFVNFVRSLSTVLAFAYCTNSVIQQMHKVMLERQDTQDSRTVGAQFVGNAIYTAVWIAAVCLFMELLGFSTQKWLTAGGLGTVLLTLAGREIFTNFLSSIMIHATRPFVHNEWIQTKIDGYEVSGTVEHVGWWSPTIVRGDDREAVHIPNHKFTVSVVRNLSQKSHWRIQTYFGISHLDVGKLSSIVADMRKVLAKHPQVEQRKLHRRVFFESISSENQALMVLVSCFVKTPHFEEYLRVKEVILLDLMKVISHHHARLATPIRSMQRVIDDIDPRNAPFRDTNRPAESQGRPYLLIEATAIANTYTDVDQSANSKNGSALVRDNLVNTDGNESDSGESMGPKKEISQANDEVLSVDGISKSCNSSEWVECKVVNKHMSQLEGLDSMGLNSKDTASLGAAFEKPVTNITEDPVVPQTHGEESTKPISGIVSTTMDLNSSDMADRISQPRQKLHAVVSEHMGASTAEKTRKVVKDLDGGSSGDEKDNVWEEASKVDFYVDQKIDLMRIQLQSASSSKGESFGTKSHLEENLVLGVALNGPKQMLPLDNATECREFVGTSNGISGNTDKEMRSGSQASNKGHSEFRGIVNAAENNH